MKACGLKRKLCELAAIFLCLFYSGATALDRPRLPIDLPLDLPIINVLSPIPGDKYLPSQPILVAWDPFGDVATSARCGGGALKLSTQTAYLLLGAVAHGGRC